MVGASDKQAGLWPPCHLPTWAGRLGQFSARQRLERTVYPPILQPCSMSFLFWALGNLRAEAKAVSKGISETHRVSTATVGPGWLKCTQDLERGSPHFIHRIRWRTLCCLTYRGSAGLGPVINNLLDRETAFSERSWGSYNTPVLSSSELWASGRKQEARTEDSGGLLPLLCYVLQRSPCKTRISYCGGLGKRDTQKCLSPVIMLWRVTVKLTYKY